ncbi:hypothetical protein D3C77_695210 [compost metagenome]
MLQPRPTTPPTVEQTTGFFRSRIQGGKQVLAQGFDGFGVHKGAFAEAGRCILNANGISGSARPEAAGDATLRG